MIHHIVSSFSLDNFGELGVISISIAQFAHPGLAFTDLMALLLNWFRNDLPVDALETTAEQVRTAAYAFGRLSQGLEMGLSARPLFPVIWEERFSEDLEGLRAELGIVAVQGRSLELAVQPHDRRGAGGLKVLEVTGPLEA